MDYKRAVNRNTISTSAYFCSNSKNNFLPMGATSTTFHAPRGKGTDMNSCKTNQEYYFNLICS